MSNENEKLALQVIIEATAGPQLDRLVHRHVFNREGPPKKYSTDISKITPCMDTLTIGVGRSAPKDYGFREDKPYWAGHPSVALFNAATPEIALCKAALFFSTQL